MTKPAVVTDPVCGMDIEEKMAAGRSEYKGQTYFFCGAKCKERFDLHPDEYLYKSPEQQTSDHGCCS